MTVRRVSPDVDRLGDTAVNFYLVHHPDGLVLVDAGLPGHLGQLQDHLNEAGIDLGNVEAVLLTHAHPDHTGLVTALHQAGVPVWVHALDAPILTDGPRSAMRHAKPERSLLSYLVRRPVAVSTPVHMARRGGFTAPTFAHARTFQGDRTFDELPGSPHAFTVAGHTPGSTAYVFPDLGVLFTGDALVTHDSITGHHGPSTVCRGFTHDSTAALIALDRLDAYPNSILLPGHGDPFTEGIRTATAQARRFGAS